MRLPNFEFTSILLLCILACSVPYIWMSAADVFAMIQIPHSSAGDIFFSRVTLLGNTTILGFGAALIIVLNRAHRRIQFMSLIITAIICSVIVCICKHFIWPDAPRPLIVIGTEGMQLVDGVRLHSRNSFPSGHAATAVAILYVLANDSKRNVRIGLVIVAVLISYSRIYLNQHFVIDVTAGALTGLISGIAGIRLVHIFNFKPIRVLTHYDQAETAYW